MFTRPVHGGALAVIRYANIHGVGHQPWLEGQPASPNLSFGAWSMGYNCLKLCAGRWAC
jgi:hypothetical protein